MGQNQVILRHQKFTFLRAKKWASERTSERSGGRERSEQSGASEWVSGAKERANRQASGPLLTSRFLLVSDQSVLCQNRRRLTIKDRHIFPSLSCLKVEKCRYEYFMDVNIPAQITTAPAQPPTTWAAVYTAWFYIDVRKFIVLKFKRFIMTDADSSPLVHFCFLFMIITWNEDKREE